MTTSHVLSTLSNEQEVLLNLQPKYAPSAAAHGIAGNDPGQGFATSHLTGLPAGTCLLSTVQWGQPFQNKNLLILPLLKASCHTYVEIQTPNDKPSWPGPALPVTLLFLSFCFLTAFQPQNPLGLLHLLFLLPGRFPAQILTCQFFPSSRFQLIRSPQRCLPSPPKLSFYFPHSLVHYLLSCFSFSFLSFNKYSIYKIRHTNTKTGFFCEYFTKAYTEFNKCLSNATMYPRGCVINCRSKQRRLSPPLLPRPTLWSWF